MTRIASFLLGTAVVLAAADDPWTKVQELKSGSDLRIYKKGASQPLTARFDEANEERIVIVVKNEQMSIPKEDIDRVDARAGARTPRKMIPDTKVKTNDPDYTPRPAAGAPVPSTSYSTGLSVSGGKPDFEIVYRRAAGAPKKSAQDQP